MLHYSKEGLMTPKYANFDRLYEVVTIKDDYYHIDKTHYKVDKTGIYILEPKEDLSGKHNLSQYKNPKKAILKHISKESIRRHTHITFIPAETLKKALIAATFLFFQRKKMLCSIKWRKLEKQDVISKT
jgi:hypothetical protein